MEVHSICTLKNQWKAFIKAKAFKSIVGYVKGVHLTSSGIHTHLIFLSSSSGLQLDKYFDYVKPIRRDKNTYQQLCSIAGYSIDQKSLLSILNEDLKAFINAKTDIYKKRLIQFGGILRKK